MPKQKVDESFIILQSLKLFRKRSYYNTSMADIAKECGLQKGSLYHYFPSKEELMKRVIQMVHQYFKDHVFMHAYDKSKSPSERMKALFDSAERVFLYETSASLMGNVGVESALMIPEFADLVKQFFLDFFHAVKTIYLDKYSETVANELAERSVAEIEGSMMFARVFNDHSFLLHSTKRILKRLEKNDN
ncbi:MAG TPA: TetR/AcrR family transcriptional regulator [Chitinophagales bacterium]